MCVSVSTHMEGRKELFFNDRVSFNSFALDWGLQGTLLSWAQNIGTHGWVSSWKDMAGISLRTLVEKRYTHAVMVNLKTGKIYRLPDQELLCT